MSDRIDISLELANALNELDPDCECTDDLAEFCTHDVGEVYRAAKQRVQSEWKTKIAGMLIRAREFQKHSKEPEKIEIVCATLNCVLTGKEPV